MATDLGKVGMRARGDWSSSATYEGLDAVSYNNCFYIAKQDVPANTNPTNTTYWMVAVDVSGKSDKTETAFKKVEDISGNTTKVIALPSTASSALVIVGNQNRTQDQTAVGICTFNSNPIILKSSELVTITDNSSREISVTSIANNTISVYYV